LSNKILFTGCYFVTFISFVHSHILCVFLIIPLHCMHLRMPYVLIKELTYLLTCLQMTSDVKNVSFPPL